MRWIKITDKNPRLPYPNERVLIYTNCSNVFGHDRKPIKIHVAEFVMGRTKEQVQLESPKRFEWADEHDNNKKPYRWQGDGPCSWFGQEVTHWTYINEPHD